MKNIFKYIGILSIAAVALVSCKKEEAFKPGEPEEANCYGVYFPSQEASGSHTYDPTAEKVITVTVARTNSTGAITVPVEVTSNVEDVFVVEPVMFADGQSETEVKVSFPTIELGKESSFSITVADNQYASKYSEGAISIDCSILCVEWQYFLNPVTGEPAVFSYYEDFYECDHTCNVRFYEVAGVRYCETINSVYEGAGKVYKGFYPGYDEAKFVWYLDTEDPDGNEFVQFKTYFCYTYSGSPTYLYDYYGYWMEFKPQASLAGMSFLDFANKYASSYPLSYYDGNGIFHFETYAGVPALGGGFGWYNTDLIADGFSRVDYSIEMEPALSADGVLPIDFALGADVAKVKYMAFEGELTAGQIANQLATVEESADAIEVVPAEADFDEDDNCYYVTAETTLPKTGVYTLIALTFDKDGAVQESATATCTYVSADAADQEKNAVQLTCGLGSAEKYEGVSTDTALEFWAYGKNIVDAKIAVFSKADLVGSYDACITKLYKAKSLGEDDLAALNEGTLVTVVKNLLPGTEYYAVVYASNGYLEDVFVSEASLFTTGDPLPIYKKYTYADYAGEAYDLGTKAETIGRTFNCYATDLFGKIGMNEYIGKVKISDCSYEDGTYDYITMTGLAGPYSTKYKFDDSFAAIIVGGVIFPSAKANCDSTKTVYALTEEGKAYNNGRYMSFQAVADGYYALCASKGNYSAGYDFCGLGWVASGSFYAAYVNYILVDPAKDDNGIAPKAAATVSAPRMLEINKSRALSEDMNKPSVSENTVTVYNNFKRVEGAVCPAQAVKASAKTVRGARPEKVSGMNRLFQKDTRKSL